MNKYLYLENGTRSSLLTNEVNLAYFVPLHICIYTVGNCNIFLQYRDFVLGFYNILIQIPVHF